MKATTPASRSSVDTADSRTATASALRRKSGLAVMAVAASLAEECLLDAVPQRPSFARIAARLDAALARLVAEPVAV